MISCIIVAGCIRPPQKTTAVQVTQTNVATPSSTPPQKTKAVQVTQTNVATPSSTPTPEQIDRWVYASPNKNVYNTGDAASIDGEISGSKGPVSISFFLNSNALAKDFSRPKKTASVMPASDSTFHYSYTINPDELPVESYYIIIKLPTGEWTKLQIFVEAKGVDCDQICSQPGPALRYNEKGEAICPC